MRSLSRSVPLSVLFALIPLCLHAQTIKPEGYVFIQSDGGPFHDEVSAALLKKGVPLVQVKEKDRADYILSGELDAENHIGHGVSMFPQASSHAMLILADKDGKQVFSCSSTKGRAYNGYRSVAEDCAKNLKKAIVR